MGKRLLSDATRSRGNQLHIIDPVKLPESEGGGYTDTLPSRLYHYTPQVGLLGILKSGHLRCSNALFLNDAEEIRYSVDLMKELLLEKLKVVEADPAEEGLIAYLRQGIDSLSESPLYVFSLSVDGNLLSQWRAYCPEGGYSIGFSGARLRQLGDEQDFELVQCIYDTTRQETAFTRLITANLTYFRGKRGSGEEVSSKLLRRCEVEFLTSFYRLAARFKAPAFKEEREWRLVSGPFAANEGAVHFRMGGSTPVPYIKFRLRENESPYLPISRIWIGPTPHPELAVRAVEGLARSHASPAAGVKYSEIPYRTW